MGSATEPKKERAPTLYVIIAMKLAKGFLMALLAARVYTLHDPNLPEDFRQTLEFFHLDPEKRFFTEVAGALEQITPSNIRWFARGTVLYSLFSLVEGFGLIFRLRWVGWLTIGESAFFVPIEVYELVLSFRHSHHVRQTGGLFVILGLNVLIVWYLFQNRQRLFHRHSSAA
jgi:uncharacterized membrane protein (DUF2068 family)